MGLMAIFGFLGTAIKSLFGWKETQATAVMTGLKVIGDMSSSQAQREAAIAQIISSEATSGYWLAACWRPLLMLIFMFLIVSFWFGFSPHNLNAPMPPMIDKIFNLIEIGLYGYIPARSVEKIVQQLNLGSVLKTLISKQVL